MEIVVIMPSGEFAAIVAITILPTATEKPVFAGILTVKETDDEA